MNHPLTTQDRFRAAAKLIAIWLPIYLLVGLLFQGIFFGTPSLDFLTGLHILGWLAYAVLAFVTFVTFVT